MSEPVVFSAVVGKVQTMADGGLRFIFDAGEAETMAAAQLMECKRFGAVLKVTCEPILTELDNETEKGTEGNGTEVDRPGASKRRDKRTRG